MTSGVFKKLYDQLNIEQKAAVDAIDGPVMVIAGPGTGKTQILTLRIANILRLTDTDPTNILALTFTESAVYSMRKRLAEIIGADAYRVNIFTFHGFCNTLIQNYIEYFSKMVGFVPARESDQIEIIEKILEENSFEKLKKLPTGIERKDVVVSDILSAISTLKRENVSVPDFKKTVLKKEKEFYGNPDVWSDRAKDEDALKAKYIPYENILKKNKELVKIYGLYEKLLEKKGFYDYDDMIVSVVSALAKNKKLLSVLQEQYQYLLVDEHQDTNSAQNKVIELMASFYDLPNLFIVGDEKQAIFRFQGADLSNFLYFKKIYPKVKVINLERNYRSTQRILDSAHSLISRAADGEKRTGLVANKKIEGAKIHFLEFNEENAESYFIAADIKQKIEDGVKPQEIAVLVRKNRDIHGISKFLSVLDVPYVIDSEDDIMSDSDMKKLVKILRAIEKFDEDHILAEAIYVDLWNISTIDIYEIFRLAKEKKMKLIKLIANPKIREDLPIESKNELNNFVQKILTWHSLSKNVGLADLFEKVINESGFLKKMLEGNESIEKMEKLNVLFDELRNLVERNRNAGLKDFLGYIDLLESRQISIKRKIKGNLDLPRIKIMTAHRSKGREFDYVYIANAYDGHWGNVRSPNGIKLVIGDINSENDDERRLFYVALTRARLGIAITYAKNNSDGKSRLPTSFIADIDDDLIQKIDTSEYENQLASDRHKIFAIKDRDTAPLKDRAYLNARFLEYGLSVTALNNYLRCPWEYFYNNLVRIPSAEKVFALYGQAIHYALENFFNKFKLGEKATKEDMISFFMKSLESKPLSQKDFDFQKKRGIEALSGYFETYRGEWGLYPYTNEFNIRGIEIDTDLKDSRELRKIKIGGKLDKLDFITEKDVRVIDFKTSKPKSRNEIEGKTGDKSGDMKRQLVFYKLLLDKYNGGQYKMIEAVIDFVEPNENKKYKRERFMVQQSEVESLEKEIKRVAGEILNLDFWNKKCDDKDCKYCELRFER